jgi:multidrug efflux pump subunit AcrB
MSSVPALTMIHVILVAQTGSFAIPVVVMLAIPLTLLGVMPGFRLLDRVAGGAVGGHADPVCRTATAMLSALPITLDPIFAGLGWSLIFGPVASTLFTLFVIPISYRLLRC